MLIWPFLGKLWPENPQKSGNLRDIGEKWVFWGGIRNSWTINGNDFKLCSYTIHIKRSQSTTKFFGLGAWRHGDVTMLIYANF